MAINLGDEEQPEIGLIALIDCIFFLLMFFMVATSFKQTTEQKKNTPLPVTLPQSAVKLDGAAAAEPRFVIGIDATGNYYLNGKRTTLDALRTSLHNQAGADSKQRIRIDGDRATAYQNIVRVIELCQFEGLTNISMNTRH
ncbi:MAG: ExbD/TolR family protein [Gammaproteobacteria bacterium]